MANSLPEACRKLAQESDLGTGASQRMSNSGAGHRPGRADQGERPRRTPGARHPPVSHRHCDRALRFPDRRIYALKNDRTITGTERGGAIPRPSRTGIRSRAAGPRRRPPVPRRIHRTGTHPLTDVSPPTWRTVMSSRAPAAPTWSSAVRSPGRCPPTPAPSPMSAVTPRWTRRSSPHWPCRRRNWRRAPACGYGHWPISSGTCGGWPPSPPPPATSSSSNTGRALPPPCPALMPMPG